MDSERTARHRSIVGNKRKGLVPIGFPSAKKLTGIPRPPNVDSESTNGDQQLPVRSYKTTQLRRERFKKPPTCRSAPLVHHSSGKDKSTDERQNLKIEPGILTNSHSAVELQSHSSLGVSSPLLNQEADPILAYITTARYKLGLVTKPERHSSDISGSTDYVTGTSRETAIAGSGPITGVKDLKLLSHRLSSLSDTMATHSSIEFVYALRNDTLSKFNPYDLRIVSAEEARTQQYYYTISAYSVTRVERHKGMDTVPSQRWLWERSIFSILQSLPFIAKFKLWKSFSAWRRTICRQKFLSQKMALSSTLFSADMLLQKAILQIQYLCESASTTSLSCSVPDNEITLIEISASVVYSLEDFMELQEETVSLAKNRLKCLRENIVAVALSACKIVAETKGILGLTEDIPKENEPSHIQVLEWRKELERLGRFVTLCNNLVLQFLQRLVLKAVTKIEARVKKSVKVGNSKIEGRNELFREMRDKVMSQPHMTSVINRFDYDEEQAAILQLNPPCTCAMSLVDVTDPVVIESSILYPPEEEESAHDITTSAVDSLVRLLTQKQPKPIIPLWEVQLGIRHLSGCNDATDGDSKLSESQPEVSLHPPKESFLSAFSQLLKQYEIAVTSFESLLKDERLRPYITRSKYDFLMMLEEREAHSSKERVKVWPDIHTLLHNYTPYQHTVDDLKRILQQTMSRVEMLSQNYQCFVEMVQVCGSIDIRSSMEEREWSVSMFQKAFSLLHDQVFGMESMVLSFQTGMVMVDANNFQQASLAHPRSLLKELEYLLPKLAADKSDVFVRKIKLATDKLLNTPTDVNSFIHYLDDVEEATNIIPDMEVQLHTITNLYTVAQQFDVNISDEETALYKGLFPQFRHLKNVLMQAQATKSETVHQFGDDLKSQVVALLHEAMELKNDIESQNLLEKSPQEALQQLEVYETMLKEMVTQAKTYVEYHHRFGKVPTSKRRYHSSVSSSHSWTPEEVYDEVMSVHQVLEVRQSLFTTTQSWNSKYTAWTTKPLDSLDVSEIQNETNGFLHTVDYLEKGMVHSNKLVKELREQIVLFRSWLPTISCLLNPSLKIRHWESIHQATSGNVSKEALVTITALKDTEVFEHHSVITGISNQANQEATLENMLKKVSSEWLNWEFALVPYKGLSERQTHLLGGIDDLLSSLEDSLTTLNTIKSSRYVEPIKHAVTDWERRLLLMLEVIEYWVLCQKNWLYLESIFSAIDMQRQLTSEAKQFLQADKSWRDVIRLITDKPTALKATNTPGVLEAFQACNVLLEQVFKSLEDYLETKRMSFPRFYFISDSELLDILAHTKQPSAVEPYLCKLFGNIKRLEMSSEVKVAPPILAIVSAEEETVELSKKTPARGSPEMWLDTLEKAMVTTVKQLLKNGVTTIGMSCRKDWIMQHAGQVVLTVAQIDWTQRVESNFQSEDGMKSLHGTWLGYLEELSKLVTKEGTLDAQRNIIESLLTLGVHNRDVIHTLVCNGITHETNFEWSRHLRYYWNHKNNNCDVKQFCATFTYGNEYLGCLPRLVITPLTERCYLTLTTALHLNLGGSPVGPAGTGKSETVKDLAKAMGKLCLVFNCSDGLNHKIMGKFFAGICQSGIWCCFDEFNRIDVEVLSVIAQYLQGIKAAKDSFASRFCFEGKEMKLIPSCAAFITMNPGYAGRVELPDNLKSLFRPVAMMVPDIAMIVEVLLFRCGFTTAPSLATKLTKVYEFGKAQLSRQKHYDFGLRAAIAVVTLAGKYLQQKPRDVSCSSSADEMKVILQAFCDSNLPKLLAEDVATMNMILGDIFQVDSGDESSSTFSVLKDYIQNAAKDHLLQICPKQIDKCCQLYTTLLVRHGVVLLGPTGGGKSTVATLLNSALNCAHRDYYRDVTSAKRLSLNASFNLPGSLSEALQAKSSHCQLKVVYPKSLSIGELYGYNDSATFEWKSGIFSKTLLMFSHQTEVDLKLARERHSKDDKKLSCESSIGSDIESTKQSSNDQESETVDESETNASNNSVGLCYPSCAPVGWKWIKLDGPVDPGWIENLNSTLDDAKVFCLSNGERIQLLPGMRLLFETDHLDNASPATVSRCGMVYMDPCDVGWRPYVISWIETLPKHYTCLTEPRREYLLRLFDLSIEKGMKFLGTYKSELTCPVPGISAVKTLCRILLGHLNYITDKFQSDNKLKTDAERSFSSITRKTAAGIYIPSSKLLKNSSQLKLRQSMSRLPGGENQSHSHSDLICDLLGKLFVFAFTWSFGGCFERATTEEETIEQSTDIVRGGLTARQKFDALVHQVFSGSDDSNVQVQLPTTADLIFSYYIDINSASFELWKTLVPSSKQILTQLSLKHKGFENVYQSTFAHFLDSETTIGKLYRANTMSLIPTVDSVRLSFLIVLLLQQQSSSHHHNILVAGKIGIGKTQLLKLLSNVLQHSKHCEDILSSVLAVKLSNLSSPLHGTPLHTSSSTQQTLSEESDDRCDCSVFFHFSPQTKTSQLQLAIENQLMRKGGNVLSPASGRKLLMCLDDLNVTTPDQFGTQQSAELLRQIIDGGGLFDQKNQSWKVVNDIRFLATVRKRSWEASPMDERSLSKFSVLCLPEPSPATLHAIYSTHITKSFTMSKFSDEVMNSIANIIACSVYVYHESRSQLLPTPATPQYIFCTKDLTKVFTGLLRVNHRGLQSQSDIINLLSHELLRVFHDRCLPQDRERALAILSEGLRIHFKVVQSPTQIKDQLLLYEDFSDSHKGYSAVKNMKKLTKHLERIQNQYNLSYDKSFQLVFFPLACEHIVRMSRVLKQPGGHLALIGIGGVGKRSCLQLAAHIAECQYHYLGLDYSQNETDCKEQLKAILVQCGVEEKQTVLVTSENNIKQGFIFQAFHELIVSGEIRDLFTREEMETISSQIAEKNALKEDNVTVQCTSSSSPNLHSMFTEKVTKNLHIVICFTPSSPCLMELCRKYPSFVTHTTVDVYDEWPSKALYGVALKEINANEFSWSELKGLSKEMVNQIVTVCFKVHSIIVPALLKAQYKHELTLSVTSSTFIHFIRMFRKTLMEQQNKINTKKTYLEAGLSHLQQADEKVLQMKQELELIQPEIDTKAQEAEALMVQLSTEQQQLDELREVVSQERADIARETEYVTRLAQESEDDLNSVLPALKSAEKGLNALKKSDLVEIRSYGTPPSMVMHVMSAVCVLLQQPTDWTTVKHLMADPAVFLKMLIGFKKNNIPAKVFSKLKHYVDDPNFQPDNVAHYSVACQSFCEWVLAIEHYGRVYRIVEPKRRLHRETSSKLQAVKDKLKMKEEQLRDLEHQLAELNEQYEIKVNETGDLQDKRKQISIKLKRAETLTQSLSDEQIRWQEVLLTLNSQTSTITGDSILSAACLVYLGPFPLPLRVSLLSKWKQLCEESKMSYNSNYNMELLTESEEVLEWYVSHLPKDTCSVQNAIVIKLSDKWPFIVDPQFQAIKWLKAMYIDHGLKVISYNDTELLRVLEQAVSAGLPVLIEDVPDQLSSTLEPFILKQVVTTHGQQFLRVGRIEIPYNPSFKLFLVTHQADLRLTSELCLKTTVVNFSATFEGLQDQLLSTIINLEEPELELEYSELLRSISSDKRQLRTMEQKMLELLKSSTGDLLKDNELVEMLQDAKQIASEVEERLESAQLTRDEIQSTRHKYQPLATRGSILYFSTVDLRHLSVMYQFSIERFYILFAQSIQSIPSPKHTTMGDQKSPEYGQIFHEYLMKLIDHFTKALHEEVSIALSSKHHLPFVFKLCCSVLQRGDETLNIEPSVSGSEWNMMTQTQQTLSSAEDDGNILEDVTIVGVSHKLSSSYYPKKVRSKLQKPEFLPEGAWESIARMEKTVSCFKGLQEHVVRNTDLWIKFTNSEDPWQFDFSDVPSTTTFSTTSSSRSKKSSQPFIPSLLSRFQKLLLIKVFTPAHLLSATRKFVSIEMGTSFIVKPLYNLHSVLNKSTPTTPVLFVLAPDTDPNAQLSQLATSVAPAGYHSYLESVSLGQGQGSKALELIQLALQKGKWIFLQNCHLAPSWMTDLERVLKSLKSAPEPHQNFRLWLSSKETHVLPSSVLQSSIKVSVEPPKGLRPSMQQLLSLQGTPTIDRQLFEDEDCGATWRQLVYSLCLFHVVTNGRKVFGTAGWRIPYGFSVVDLKVTLELLKSEMQGSLSSSVSWPTVHYLAGEICYGGRITDCQDLHCLRALLNQFCNDDSADHPIEELRSMSSDASYTECCARIEEWPVEDIPEMFGLPHSLMHAVSAGESQTFLHSLHTMKKSAVHERVLYTRHHSELLLERASQFLEKLPSPIDDASVVQTQSPDVSQHNASTIIEHSDGVMVKRLLSPYWVLFVNEISQWNERLTTVYSSLHNLISAVKGESVFNGEIEELYTALACGEVPIQWQFFAEEHQTLSKWTDKFSDCFKHITKWASLNSSLSPTTAALPRLPEKIWYPSISSPQHLFAAIIQTYSRRFKVPLEDVCIKLEDAYYSTLDSEEHPCAVVISGLGLEAASWNLEQGLIDSDLDTSTSESQTSTLPDMVCHPVKKDLSSINTNKASDVSWYSCPVYTSKMKHELVTNVFVRASQQSSHWCRRGTAMIPWSHGN